MAALNIPPPNPRQAEFFLSREKFILYGGAKGGGKSWAIRWKQLLRRFNYPNSKGLLLRRTFPELYRNHILEIQRELPKGSFKYNDQKHMFTFPNGSTLELGSVQHQADIFNYQGAEYDDIGIDEAGQFTEQMFQNLKTNLRSVRDDMKLQMYLGSNPGGVGHGWLKRLFMDKNFEHEEDPNQYRYIPAKAYDNLTLMEKQPDYIKELEALPPDLRRAYLEGDWDVFSGQVFSEWRRDKHVINYYPEGFENAPKVMAFDYGYNDMGAAIFIAKLPDGHMFQYHEIYQNRKTPAEWAEDIMMFTRIYPINHYLLPHDCFSKQHGNDSIAEVFKRHGMSPIKKLDTLSRGARQNSLALFHMYLSDAPDGYPYFQVLETCSNTIRSIPELVYETKGDELFGEDVDTDGEDHLYDAIRGALLEFGRPRGSGGGVRPDSPDRRRTAPTIIAGSIAAPEIGDLIVTKRRSRDWRYR